ncbi:MAG: hypothetical protein K2Y22_10035 [Candidatus Obscuribacterales bacterium]|nr:hypothetical protein [Candidatus Obscuribacterales bacterium]
MGSDNVNKTAPAEKHDGPSKSHTETNADAWGAKSGSSDIKIAANPSQAKPEEHGFLSVDFKGMGDAFNQAMHNTQEMISNIGKPSPEQVAAEKADKAADETANKIYDRLFNKQLSYDSTVGDINKELKAMDPATRNAVLEHLKKKEGMMSPIHVDKKDGDYVVTWGGGMGASGEHVYP